MKIRTLQDAMNEHLVAWKDRQTAESKKQKLEIDSILGKELYLITSDKVINKD